MMQRESIHTDPNPSFLVIMIATWKFAGRVAKGSRSLDSKTLPVVSRGSIEPPQQWLNVT
jgi:hypothetical protein